MPKKVLPSEAWEIHEHPEKSNLDKQAPVTTTVQAFCVRVNEQAYGAVRPADHHAARGCYAL